MYADNHQTYIVGSYMSIMCTNMDKEGNSVLKWYKDNYLLSNPEKLNAIGIKQHNKLKLNRLTSRSVIKRLRQQIISSYWV